MAAQPSLTVLPGPPATPTNVDIDCSGLDPDKSVEFLVDGTVRGTIPVDVVGNATLLYIVPPGPIRNALADLGHGDGNIDTVDGVNLVHVECDSGTMSLRYQT